jgi:glycerophosphoryl diester phosphodiesterase
MQNDGINRRQFLKMTSAMALSGALAGSLLAADTRREPSGHKILIGHRGASAYRPENTLPSYELAIKQGCDYVEQDLQITKDGVLVCSHDGTLERCTNVEEVYPDRFVTVHVKGKPVKHWNIHDFTLEEIKRLDAGSSFDPKYKGTTIPTWQEAIDLIRGKAGLCPETKSPEVYGKLGFDMVKLVLDMLKKNKLDTPRGNDSTPILFQSFSKPSLLQLHKEIGPDGWPMMQLTAKGKGNKPGLLEDIKRYAWGISPEKHDATREMTSHAHKLGLKVIAYTFLTTDLGDFKSVRDQMGHWLYDNDIDGLFTNNPDQFPRGRV